jgi:NAD(P)-dependent dehydrogenase (short-subunit alcohol dehydrogenase family)
MKGISPTNAFSLWNQTILVTGASSGIGKEIALLCASLGAKLVINGRNKVRLNETFETLEGEGHVQIVGDLIDTSTKEALIAATGSYDGFVSSSGSVLMSPFRMTPEKYFHKMMENNFFAPISLSHQLVLKKKLNNQSSIVFITALSAHASPKATSAYAASKAALESASRSMALELAPNIRVNCIAPGYVHTPLFNNLESETTSMDVLVPLGPLEPRDIAPAVTWMLSRASKWITRSTLTVDGGLSLPMRL